MRTLTSHTKRRRYIVENPEVPAVLDEITHIPNKYVIIRFAGFDKNESCVNIELERYKNAKGLQMDLEVPGLGHFSYSNRVVEEMKHSTSMTIKIPAMGSFPSIIISQCEDGNFILGFF